MYFFGILIGSVVGIIFGGVIVMLMDWCIVFLIVGGLGLLFVLIFLLIM